MSSVNFHDSFYIERLSSYGLQSAQSVGWTDFLQGRLFDKISEPFHEYDLRKNYNLLDVGSGLGDYLAHLKFSGYNSLQYTGIDSIQEMVEAAKVKFPTADFIHGDFMKLSPLKQYDFIISSGSLNIIIRGTYERHLNYVKSFIERMYTLCTKFCTFNLLSAAGKIYFSNQCDNFFYADENLIYEYCRSLCPSSTIDYDRNDFIFTIHMKKA